MERTSLNPFIYSRPLAPGEGIARQKDVELLLDRALGGHHVTLYAPRRMGKTSLLKQVRVAADKRNVVNVFVDLTDVLSDADVAVRLEQAFRSMRGRLKRTVDRELGALGITSPIVGLSLQRQPREAIAVVHSLLEVPGRIAERSKRRVLLIFDEFQALIDLKGMDGVFRSHLQHQEIGCIFSGSEQSLLRALFEDRARPLYGQAEQLRLDRLDFAAAHDFVVATFARTGKDAGDIATEVIALSELHPQRLMLLSHFLWEQIGRRPGTLTDLRRAYDVAIRAVGQELRFLWDELSTNERRVLSTVASGRSPYEAGAKTAAGLVAGSSAQRAVQSLLSRALLERRDEDGFQIVDPFLARWVRLRGGVRPRFWVVPSPDGAFVVTDGPSLTFERARHQSIGDAEAEADRLAASSGQPADVMVFDTDDPNDLPDWAVRA